MLMLSACFLAKAHGRATPAKRDGATRAGATRAGANRRIVRHLLAAAMLLFCAAAATLQAQEAITPRTLTNRHIVGENDASSTAWDPSLLGMTPTGFEILGGLPFRRQPDGSTLTMYGTPSYLFAKAGPIGAGISTSIFEDSLVPIRTNYYLGFGFGLTKSTWIGAGLRASNDAGFFGSAAYTLAFTARPISQILISASAEDFTRLGTSGSVSVFGAYQPMDWLALLTNFGYRGGDTLGGATPVRAAFGVNLGFEDFPIRFNVNYELTRGVLRLGLEATTKSSTDQISVGVFADKDTLGIAGGAVIARYGSVEERPLEPETDGPVFTHRDPRGWAPTRAYSPAGLTYRYATTDAQATADALVRPCDGTGLEFDAPASLMSILPLAGKAYAGLDAKLTQLSPNPGDLYKRIRQEYYTTNVRNHELMRGDSLQLMTKQGYSIGVQSVDQSKFPEVSVIVQVTDATGRNVRGLGMNDFRFRDDQLSITSVRPLDSTFNVPVDIVVILDCSGSMRQEIQSVRANVETFVATMQARGADYRIGGVLYGSIIYDTLHPTSDIAAFNTFVANADAIGNDEITSLAIKAATEMNFRPAAQRLFLLITDDWQIQDNAALTEPELLEMLWNTGARLYTIGNPCNNNGAVMTRLSLGREYNVTSPFTSVLDDIGNDVTTQYEIVYQSKMRSEEITILRGRVRDVIGRPAPVPITLTPAGGKPIVVTPNATTGEYETEVTEGVNYAVTINGARYLPYSDDVDLSTTKHGDTVARDFTLGLPPTMLHGVVTDESGKTVVADVRIEDAVTGERITSVRSGADGSYSTTISEGRQYRLTAVTPDYIPTPADLDTRTTERGSQLTQDLRVTSIDWAIANGATFKVRNIFFDVGRWEVKSESTVELNRLADLLGEYPAIKVEVGAHTDAVGSDRDNQVLSENRARSVMEYLISKGVAAMRLRSKGYGETVPVATNDTEEGRALNRRVEFKLVR